MKAAIIGGGVIGGGWASRFLLNGWDVSVFDPDPQAERKMQNMLSNARRSLPSLYDFKLPDEGKLNFCDNLEEVVKNVEWVQESVPEPSVFNTCPFDPSAVGNVIAVDPIPIPSK